VFDVFLRTAAMCPFFKNSVPRDLSWLPPKRRSAGLGRASHSMLAKMQELNSLRITPFTGRDKVPYGRRSVMAGER